MAKKTVLITGSSSGFGKLAAKTFHKNGWNVIATMRSPERETELGKLGGVMVVSLDVTDPKSIKRAVSGGLERFGAIHVVVNNAGYGGHALFEQAADEYVRAMFETNVFGPMNVMRAVLPLMREQGDGTVINVTSMAGLIGLPGNSIYSASKHAAEGLTEAMALEYKPLGVRICIVEPGAYPSTRFLANLDSNVEAGGDQLTSFSRRLNDHFAGLAEQMANQGGQAADPQEVADKIYECATADEVAIHNPVGADAQMLIGMMTTATSRQEFLDQMAGMLLPPAAAE